jgi:hypothetical protein
MEETARKIPSTAESLRRASWVESINPWLVPAAYAERVKRHITEKKITVRLINRGSGFSFIFREKNMTFSLLAGKTTIAYYIHNIA